MNRGVGEHSIALAREWRRLGRAATFVAVLTSPALFIVLHQRFEWPLFWALVGTLIGIAAFRGLIDVLAHKMIPAPALAGAELELRDDPPADLAAPAVQRHDPGEHAQRRRLARAVAPDDGDGLARLDGERHRLQGLHGRRAVVAPPQQQLLQRAARVGAHLERAPRVLHDDLARPHTTTASSPSRRRNSRRPPATASAAPAAT